MGTFDDVEFVWGDRPYTIKADRVLGAIARIEDVVTLDELSRHFQKQTLPRARIAMAYGAALRYAGAKVMDDDVYSAMFIDSDQASVTQAVTTLLAMMLPHLKKADAEGAPRSDPPTEAV